MRRLLISLAVVFFVFTLTAADPTPAPSPMPNPATDTSAAPSATPTSSTSIPAGTVISVVDPGLLSHGRDVLHGIARDAKTGDLYIGVSHVLVHHIPFIMDTYSNDDSLRTITTSGTVTRVTSFPFPNGILINPHDGMIYVATGATNCKEVAGGMLVSTHCPGTNGIIVVNPATGDHHDFAGGPPGFADGVGIDARFTAAAGIAYDPDNGNMYVTDYGNHRIRQVTADGTVTTLAGSGTAGDTDGTGAAATFRSPRDIAYCPNDKSLYIADRDNNAIRKVTIDGVVSTVAGASEVGYVDGAAATARFDHPHGIACDAAGNIYIADTDNNAIRQISPGGVVSTLAGAKDMGTVNAVGTEARFANPSDMMYEPSDTSLYVVDRGSNNVRMVTTTVAP